MHDAQRPRRTVFVVESRLSLLHETQNGVGEIAWMAALLVDGDDGSKRRQVRDVEIEHTEPKVPRLVDRSEMLRRNARALRKNIHARVLVDRVGEAIERRVHGCPVALELMEASELLERLTVLALQVEHVPPRVDRATAIAQTFRCDIRDARTHRGFFRLGNGNAKTRGQHAVKGLPFAAGFVNALKAVESLRILAIEALDDFRVCREGALLVRELLAPNLREPEQELDA